MFAKQELFAIPGWGYSALVYGLIPVARDKGARTLREMLNDTAGLPTGVPSVVSMGPTTMTKQA